VAGAVLKTLIEKYDFSRYQLFISTKQGFLQEDSVEGIPPQVVIQELLQQDPSLETEFKHERYCAHPKFLKY